MLLEKLGDAVAEAQSLVEQLATAQAERAAALIERDREVELRQNAETALGRVLAAFEAYKARNPEPLPTLTVDGAEHACIAWRAIKTRSGTWRFYAAGEVAPDTTGYVGTLDEAPGFLQVLLARRTAEVAEGSALVARTHAVSAQLRGVVVSGSVLTAQGSVRVLRNMEPVAPNPEWLVEAVKAGKVPLFPRVSPLGKTAASVAVSSTYDPASLGGTSSSSNKVGVTSANGGEYTASRGFLHNVDACVIAAVLAGEAPDCSALIANTLTVLSHPQGGIWADGMVDPQLGKPWSRNVGAKRSGVAYMADVASWGRNTAHLENVGLVHWLLTEDPIAGLVVQRQLQFALAEYPGWRRPAAGLTGYRPCMEEPRALYNTLSALWKSQVVAESIGATDNVLWGSERLSRMVADCFAWVEKNRLAPLEARKDGRFAGRAITGLNLLDHTDDSNDPLYAKKDAAGNVVCHFRTASDFQQPQYGKEPLWLFTKAGNPIAARAFRFEALGAINRLLHLGGAMGAGEMPSSTGSGIFIGPYAADGSFLSADGKAWAEWAGATFPGPSRTSMDGAFRHTVEQLRGTLVYALDAIEHGCLAEDAEVNRETIGQAIAACDAAAKATVKWQSQPLWVKHLGRPAS